MPNEVDEFLKDIKGEKTVDSFVSDDSDPLATAQKPKEEGSDTGASTASGDEGDGEKIPFHKNPKLNRYIEKEINKRLKEIKPAEAAAPKPASADTVDELTETLIEIIGNDTPQKADAVKRFRKQLGGLEERGAQRALDQLKEQAAAEEAEVAQAEEELNTAFDSIEEEFDVDLTSNTTGAEKVRSEFIDFIFRVSPKNGEGDVTQYPDLMETWKLFQSTKKAAPSNTRAKDLASRGMQRSTDSGGTQATGKTWKDVDRIFGKLSN